MLTEYVVSRYGDIVDAFIAPNEAVRRKLEGPMFASSKIWTAPSAGGPHAAYGGSDLVEGVYGHLIVSGSS